MARQCKIGFYSRCIPHKIIDTTAQGKLISFVEIQALQISPEVLKRGCSWRTEGPGSSQREGTGRLAIELGKMTGHRIIVLSISSLVHLRPDGRSRPWFLGHGFRTRTSHWIPLPCVLLRCICSGMIIASIVLPASSPVEDRPRS